MSCYECRGKGYTREYAGRDGDGNAESENVPCDCSYILPEFEFEVQLKVRIKAKNLSKAQERVEDMDWDSAELMETYQGDD